MGEAKEVEIPRILNQIFDQYELEYEKKIAAMSFYLKEDEAGFVNSRIVPGAKVFSHDVWNKMVAKRGILKLRYALSEEQPHAKAAAAVIGPCGHGKTSLVNNLCGTKNATGEAMDSKTKRIYPEMVKHLSSEFLMIDTPGTTSQTQVSTHARIIHSALTYQPLNVIFVNIKFDSRGNNLISDMQHQIKCLGEDKSRVVFLVSHADASKELNKMTEDISAEMNQRNLHQQVVFYSNDRCDTPLLANVLYRIASKKPMQRFVIDEDIFVQEFSVLILDRMFDAAQRVASEKMQQLTDMAKEFIQNMGEHKEKNDMTWELGLWLRLNLQSVFRLFEKQNKDRMLEHDYFKPYQNMKKRMVHCNEIFAVCTNSIVVRKIMGNGKISLLDMIKQCPNPKCNLIWERVEACPRTTCGNRPTNFWDWTGTRKYSYNIKVRDNKIVQMRRLEQQSEVFGYQDARLQQYVVVQDFDDLQEQENTALQKHIKEGKQLEKLKEEQGILRMQTTFLDRVRIKAANVLGMEAPEELRRLAQVTNLRASLEKSVAEQKKKLKQKNKEHGCGCPMNFDTLPRVPGLQKKLEEWYCVNNIGELDLRILCDKQIEQKREASAKLVRENQTVMEHLPFYK